MDTLPVNTGLYFDGCVVLLCQSPIAEHLGLFHFLFLPVNILCCIYKPLAFVPTGQLLHLPLPADGSCRPPWGHALWTLRDLPTVPTFGQEPSLNQQPVAVDLRRHCPQGQPAGGSVLQCLPALLRACSL